MRLMQLSRESLNFPPPDMALREPNGLLAIRFCGGRQIRARCFGQKSFISAAA